MASTSTITLSGEGQVPQAVASGPWDESIRGKHISYRITRLARKAGMIVSLAVTSFTAAPVSVYKEKVVRSITLREAHRIAREILQEAERERREVVESEGLRGIQWEDVS